MTRVLPGLALLCALYAVGCDVTPLDRSSQLQEAGSVVAPTSGDAGLDAGDGAIVHAAIDAAASTTPFERIDAAIAPDPDDEDGGTDGGAQQELQPFRIVTAVVALAYHDFPSLPVKRWSKFEVFFNRTIDTLQPAQVKSIHVDGPNRYTFDFANQTFSLLFPNGYIVNESQHFFWYQALLPGFLADGTYTITMTLVDGTTSSYSRTLHANLQLLDFYLGHAGNMGYSPNSDTSSSTDTVLRWSTFNKLGGPNAYYNVWISPGTSDAIDPATARGDTIFRDALKKPKAGLNRNHSRMGSAAWPLAKGPQTWQPEILDANVLNEINMIIFPPGQHFTAD
jgi:hypothetical protein